MKTKTRKPRTKPGRKGSGLATDPTMDRKQALKVLQEEDVQNRDACLAKIQSALDEYGYTLVADIQAHVDRRGYTYHDAAIGLVPAPTEQEPG